MNPKKIIPFLILISLFHIPSFAQFGSMGGYGMSSMHSHYNYINYIQTYHRKKENGENVDPYYRVHQGVTFGLINASYKLDYTIANSAGTGKEKTYFYGNIETKVKGMAYGLTGEQYFPLGKTGEQSLIALTLGADMIYLKMTFDEVRINGGQSFTPEHNILQGNIPLGLAYKSGTDAVLRSSVKSGFSIGGGALANMNFDMSGENFPTINLRPYCMAEMSFYTGFCWKIRGTAHLGNVNLSVGDELGLSSGSSEDEISMTLVSKPSFFISLILNEFSWDWDEY